MHSEAAVQGALDRPELGMVWLYQHSTKLPPKLLASSAAARHCSCCWAGPACRLLWDTREGVDTWHCLDIPVGSVMAQAFSSGIHWLL